MPADLRPVITILRALLIILAATTGGPAWLWALAVAVAGPVVRVLAAHHVDSRSDWRRRSDALRRATKGLP